MIYCVEDDSNIRELLLYTLHNSGFEAKGIEDGEALFAEMAREKPLLILLDVMLPGENGIEILKRIRLDMSSTQYPRYYADRQKLGIRQGDRSGLRRRRLRMQALRDDGTDFAHQSGSAPHRPRRTVSDMLVCGNVVLNVRGHSVTVDGRPVELTLKEFELLQAADEKSRRGSQPRHAARQHLGL